jgi:hemoglobin
MKHITVKFGALTSVFAAFAFGVCHAQTMVAPTLFSQLGGQDGVTSIIKDSIELWKKNPVLAESFKNANAPRLEVMLVQQICSLTDGGCTYGGRDMRSIHASMGVTTAQFNALAEDLQSSLANHNIPFATQNKLIALLAPMKRDVVTN